MLETIPRGASQRVYARALLVHVAKHNITPTVPMFNNFIRASKTENIESITTAVLVGVPC